jgi:hypothetical protein
MIRGCASMETRIFQDPNPPAYFQAANKPFQVISQTNQTTGRVEFLVIGEGVDAALQEFYSDPMVGVLSFVKELKSLRSSIFAMKTPAPGVRR